MSTTKWTFLFIIVLQSCSHTEHRRIGQVPPDAIWVGGQDGGSWFKVNQVLPNSQFKISVYNDQNGQLLITSVFKMDTTCVGVNLDSADLLKHINAFDGTRVLLNIDNHGISCSLVPELQ